MQRQEIHLSARLGSENLAVFQFADSATVSLHIHASLEHFFVRVELIAALTHTKSLHDHLDHFESSSLKNL